MLTMSTIAAIRPGGAPPLSGRLEGDQALALAVQQDQGLLQAQEEIGGTAGKLLVVFSPTFYRKQVRTAGRAPAEGRTETAAAASVRPGG